MADLRNALFLIVILLAGCGPTPDTELQRVPPMKPAIGPRFSVSRVGVFRYEIAYDEVRGIYVIVDSQTGKEYVGVSGVGIAETGSHQAGKTQHEDER